MVTTRTLERRRAVLAPGHQRSGRRRRVRADIVLLADYAAGRLRLGPVVRLSVALLIVLSLLVVYLVLAAQVTAASYLLQQQRQQQQQLTADLEQRHYEVATLTSPASIDDQARATGLTRVTPNHYLPYVAARIDVLAPIGKAPVDNRRPWQILLSDALQLLGGPSNPVS